jgi:hypothetical protein
MSNIITLEMESSDTITNVKVKIEGKKKSLLISSCCFSITSGWRMGGL